MAAPSAHATPVVAIALEIDDSGSISTADFNLQKTGYINALTAVLPADGSVAIQVDEFSSTVEPVFALQTITATTKATLLAAITAMIDHGGSTATGPAIQSAASKLLAFGGVTKRIIDVSTDGFGNVGINEATAATNAVTAGIDQVNVLCIGAAANCSFNKGAGSFNMPATFANIESTLTAKLQREIPEPGTVALLGVGLLGLGLTVSRRRRET